MHDAHITRSQIRDLHETLLDIIAVMNRPQHDEELVRDAGVALDRALFRLLVGIERRGPVGIVALAEAIGRDYTTVSRQVARLERLGLVKRHQSQADRRVTEAVTTERGRAMTERIDTARARIVQEVFSDWSTAEVDDLLRLMRKLAATIQPPEKE